MKRDTYYMSRVVKLGEIKQDSFIAALVNAQTVQVGKFKWTITNIVDESKAAFPFVAGRLSKFSSEGHIKLVDENQRSEVDAVAPNLSIASAQFVYLPEHSGLAFTIVWNQIEQDVFPKRLERIVEEAHENFFAECAIEPITDYRTFTAKLRKIQVITEIDAKINPPNPRYGRLWESLYRYVKRRNASEVKVVESANESAGIASDLVKLVEQILENPDFQPEEEVDIADAALLMAADGYGHGKISGLEDGMPTVIRTSDSHKSFAVTSDSGINEIAIVADKKFRQTVDERGMDH